MVVTFNEQDESECLYRSRREWEAAAAKESCNFLKVGHHAVRKCAFQFDWGVVAITIRPIRREFHWKVFA